MATPAASPTDRPGVARPSLTSPLVTVVIMKRTVRGTARVARASALRPRNRIMARYGPTTRSTTDGGAGTWSTGSGGSAGWGLDPPFVAPGDPSTAPCVFATGFLHRSCVRAAQPITPCRPYYAAGYGPTARPTGE